MSKKYEDYTQEERSLMAKEDRVKLKALQNEYILRPMIEKATGGGVSGSRWYRTHGCIGVFVDRPGFNHKELRMLFEVDRNEKCGLYGTESDARFVAATDPHKVGELLDIVKLLLAERDFYKIACNKLAEATENG